MTSELLAGTGWVTDGGLETDLMFNHGVELPEFASFPLVEDAAGRDLLQAYYAGYVAVAAFTTWLTIYTMVKSQRLSDFIDALSNDRLGFRGKMAALARVWRPGSD